MQLSVRQAAILRAVQGGAREALDAGRATLDVHSHTYDYGEEMCIALTPVNPSACAIQVDPFAADDDYPLVNWAYGPDDGEYHGYIEFGAPSLDEMCARVVQWVSAVIDGRFELELRRSPPLFGRWLAGGWRRFARIYDREGNEAWVSERSTVLAADYVFAFGNDALEPGNRAVLGPHRFPPY